MIAAFVSGDAFITCNAFKPYEEYKGVVMSNDFEVRSKNVSTESQDLSIHIANNIVSVPNREEKNNDSEKFMDIVKKESESCIPPKDSQKIDGRYCYKLGELLYKDSLEADDSVKIANFDLKLNSERTVQGKNKSKVFYIFDILLPNKEDCVYNVRVVASDVTDLRWIKDKSNGKAFITRNKNAINIIQERIVEMINTPHLKEIEFRENGWKKLPDGRWGYVIHDGIIGRKDCIGISGNQSSKLSYDIQYLDSKDTFISAMNIINITKNPKSSLPLFLLVHMAYICKVFEVAGYPLKFITAYIGKTNSKKTSIAKVLTQLFNVDKNEAIVSFTSKECGVEEFCSSHPDSVVLIDDFRPSESAEKTREMKNVLEYLQRSYGDGSTRKRMKAFQNEEIDSEFPPEGCCLLTGEYMTGVMSSLTRTITVYTDLNQCNDDILSWYQENNKILPSHIYSFISYVTAHFEAIQGFLKENIPKVRRKYKNEFKTNRFSENFAQFSSIIDIILDYGECRGFINSYEHNSYREKFNTTMFEVLKENDTDLKNVNIDDLFIIRLYEFFTSNEIKIPNLNDTTQVQSDIYDSEEIIYVKMEMIKSIAKKIYETSGYIPQPKELLKKLEASETILVKEESGSMRRSHKLPYIKNNNIRYVYFYKKKLDEFVKKKSEEYDF